MEHDYSLLETVLEERREWVRRGTWKSRGVYALCCDVTGEMYVGQTRNHFLIRWLRHIWKLENGVHEYERLQRLWDDHGREAFTFAILEVWTPDLGLGRLCTAERRWQTQLGQEGLLITR